jgi:Asp-tRNA(Asn)/Glu-tRNA(Gln) amidotransferase C subunit
MREDDVGPALPTEAVLSNAPQADGTFFMVPKVIGGAAAEDSAG